MATATRATALLVRRRVTHTVHAYPHDPRADSFGERRRPERWACPRSELFKTLIAVVDAKLVCAVVPVSGRLSLKALAAAVGGKRAEYGRSGGGAASDRLRDRWHLAARAADSAAGRDRLDRSRSSRRCSSPPAKRGLQVELAPADLVESHVGKGRAHSD